jgi:hypothetical protein
MDSVIAQVVKWHDENVDRLSKHFEKISLRSNSDPQQGGAVIEIEAKTLVASITFWNKGDVEVLVLERSSQNPIDLDDRVLSPDENVSSLLDGYIQEILLRSG